MNRKETVFAIAAEHVPWIAERGSFKAKNRDSEDFLDVSVWALEKALSAAYDAGFKARSWTVLPPNSFAERF